MSPAKMGNRKEEATGWDGAMTGDEVDQQSESMLKIVYFDEQSASDYLDISAGGSASSSTEHVRTRAHEVHAAVESKVAAKLSWLPFLGVSAEAGAALESSRVGQSILSKTLSNTILTDYLHEVASDRRIRRLRDFRVTAPHDSMAFAKMYTPYMIIARTEDQGVDLARLDEALEKAKGYYELLADSTDSTDGEAERCVLRFNIAAFRNNYGLTDLGQMRLVHHAILVGRAPDSSLSMNAQFREEADSGHPTALDLMNQGTMATASELDVYDVLLSGVEHAHRD